MYEKNVNKNVLRIIEFLRIKRFSFFFLNLGNQIVGTFFFVRRSMVSIENEKKYAVNYTKLQVLNLE